MQEGYKGFKKHFRVRFLYTWIRIQERGEIDFKNVKCVFISVYNEFEYAQAAIRQGASGFIERLNNDRLNDDQTLCGRVEQVRVRKAEKTSIFIGRLKE